MKDNAIAIGGAILGSVVGYFTFKWLLKTQGLYGLALPGGLLGVGAGLWPNRALWVSIVCGVAALVLGLVAEFNVTIFAKETSFVDFVTHPGKLPTWTLLMIVVGTAVGFWVPFRRRVTADEAR